MAGKAAAQKARYKYFAWQNFSCNIPEEWNLAGHKDEKHSSSIRLQDDYSHRLDFEWTQPRHPLRADAARRAYDRMADAMRKSGAEGEAMPDMPGGWTACLYAMPDGRLMVAAFYFPEDRLYFGVLKMYFENTSRREPERVAREMAGSFRVYSDTLAPWAVYDAEFRLATAFRLTATSFQAGRKLFVFEWRSRKLFLFFISLADMLVREQSIETWCAKYLDGFKGISGASFSPGENGVILAERRWRRYVGNMEPVVRGCLRYSAFCRRVADKNQIFIALFNYRRAADADFLAGSLVAPGAAPAAPRAG